MSRKSHLVACITILLSASSQARATDGEPVSTAHPGGMPGLFAKGFDAAPAVKRFARDAKARSLGVVAGPRELEQVLVVPQRPGRTNVRWYDFDWRRFDYLDDRGVGGVRFYFYEREREIAGIAAALVREQYEVLAKRFNYRPTQRVPYILYNSHREFENTNVFFVSEGVLGVTSPRDLRMALPY